MSVEAPMGISFVYGFDYHSKWYTQLKPAVGFAWINNGFMGRSNEIQYALFVEQRYYYNMLKREEKGKRTDLKSANYFSVKPAYMLSRIKYDKDNYIVQLTGKDKYYSNKYWCTVNWGLRRAMGKRFYFDGSIGLGPSYLQYDGWSMTREINLGFGFLLKKP